MCVMNGYEEVQCTYQVAPYHNNLRCCAYMQEPFGHPTYSHGRVQQFTTERRVGECVLSSSDRLIFPLWVDTVHWACACVDLQNRALYYLDSLEVRFVTDKAVPVDETCLACRQGNMLVTQHTHKHFCSNTVYVLTCTPAEASTST